MTTEVSNQYCFDFNYRMLLKSNQFSLAELDLIILKWSKLILISIKLLYNESYKLYCVSYKTQQAWKDGLDREQQKQTLVVSWYALSSFWLNMWSLIWTCGMGDNKQGRSQRGGTLLPRTDKIGKKIGENPKKNRGNQEKMGWKSGKNVMKIRKIGNNRQGNIGKLAPTDG